MLDGELVDMKVSVGTVPVILEDVLLGHAVGWRQALPEECRLDPFTFEPPEVPAVVFNRLDHFLAGDQLPGLHPFQDERQGLILFSLTGGKAMEFAVGIVGPIVVHRDLFPRDKGYRAAVKGAKLARFRQASIVKAKRIRVNNGV